MTNSVSLPGIFRFFSPEIKPNGYEGYAMPSEDSNKTRLIYGILFREQWYVGKTQQALKNRISKHLSEARLGTRTKIALTLKKHFDKTNITILEEVAPTDDICERERFWILKLNAYRAGLNLSSGGEGGSAAPESAPLTPKSKQIIQDTAFNSPPKGVTRYRFYRNRAGEIDVRLSPTAYKINNAVYGIGNKSEEYTGVSGKTIAKRARGHVSRARRLERRPNLLKKNGGKSKFYRRLLKSPEKFEIYPLKANISPSKLFHYEAEAIPKRREVKVVLNSTNGRNGSSPSYPSKPPLAPKNLKLIFDASLQLDKENVPLLG